MSKIKYALLSLTILFSFQSYAQNAVLTSLNSLEKNDKSYLQWSTQKENNNFGFEIERSSDEQDWEVIGFINGQIKSSDYIDYQFIDQFPQNGINFYRLKQINNDGGYYHSSKVSVRIKYVETSILSPILVMMESK